MTRSRFVGAAVLLVLVLSSVMVLAQNGDSGPVIVIPKLRHDFGDVFEQTKYAYDFVVRNRGKADLIINSVKPG